MSLVDYASSSDEEDEPVAKQQQGCNNFNPEISHQKPLIVKTNE